MLCRIAASSILFQLLKVDMIIWVNFQIDSMFHYAITGDVYKYRLKLNSVIEPHILNLSFCSFVC